MKSNRRCLDVRNPELPKFFGSFAERKTLIELGKYFASSRLQNLYQQRVHTSQTAQREVASQSHNATQLGQKVFTIEVYPLRKQSDLLHSEDQMSSTH